MAYAVFDWDNTIRKGFTLFSWMNFLYEEKILDTKVRNSIASVQNQYSKKQINHDEYAKKTCEIYSSAIIGMSENIRNKLVKSYIPYDKQCLMPFSQALFEYMSSCDIKPIIISGAPRYILDKYKDMFRLYDIFAFSEKYSMGLCTGGVDYNYGVDKKKTVEKLYKVFGMKPLVGFGDSYSDIPLFEMSEYAFCVVKTGDENSLPYGKNVTYISDETNGNQIRILLQRILKLQKLKK